jgi:hypothetical protein
MRNLLVQIESDYKSLGKYMGAGDTEGMFMGYAPKLEV